MAVGQTPDAGSAEERRIAELYRAASTQEPPARLDSAIRSAARARGDARQPAPPWWKAWRAPFAVASIAIVSATIAILMYEEPPTELAEPPAAIIAPPPADMTAPPEASSQRAPDVASRQQKPQSLRRRTEDTRSAAAARPDDAARTVEDGRTAPPAPVREQAAERPAELPRQEVPMTAPEADVRQERRAPMAMGKPLPAPAAPAAARAKVAGAGAVDVSALKAELEREPARRWAERIVALRREGRAVEADALLEEYRRRFPDEPLPPSP